MYRSDQDAAIQRADAATAEAERLRRENEAMRQALVTRPPMMVPTFAALPAAAIYRPDLDVRALPLPERARLAQHVVQRSSVVGTALLNFITFGLYGLIHFSLLHDRLPRAAMDDPSSGKAIGFQFIPYYNLYWIFFNSLRLCDRLTLQLQLRRHPRRAPRGLVKAACIVTVIPYVNLVVGPILWTIAVCKLQRRANEVAALPPNAWDPTPYPMP